MKIADWYTRNDYYILYFYIKYGDEEYRHYCNMVNEEQAKSYMKRLKEENNNVIKAYYLQAYEDAPNHPSGLCKKLDFWQFLRFLNEEMFWVIEVEDGYIANDGEGEYVSKYNFYVVNNIYNAKKCSIMDCRDKPHFVYFGIHEAKEELEKNHKFRLITIKYSLLE